VTDGNGGVFVFATSGESFPLREALPDDIDYTGAGGFAGNNFDTTLISALRRQPDRRKALAKCVHVPRARDGSPLGPIPCCVRQRVGQMTTVVRSEVQMATTEEASNPRTDKRLTSWLIGATFVYASLWNGLHALVAGCRPAPFHLLGNTG